MAWLKQANENPTISCRHRSTLAVLAFSLSLWATKACAQLERESIPPWAYHLAIAEFYDGEYADALKDFQSVWRGARRTTHARWIDSICYYTMIGECHYHSGKLDEALANYTEALRLYLAYPDWLIRVQFPGSIRPDARTTRAPWGTSTRGAKLGLYPATMPIGQGQVDINQQIQSATKTKRPTVIQSAILIPIQAEEIVRSTTLAIRRRTELLGPISRHDAVTAELITQLSRRPAPPNHWSQAWVDVQLGLALIAGGKESEAIPVLSRSLVAAGQFDHSLTSVALFELGRLALARGDYGAGLQFFQEASIAAFQYFDGGILEESLRYGMIAHLLANRPGVYGPLQSAIQSSREVRQLKVSLLLCLAENLAVRGNARDAMVALEEAQKTAGRRQMVAGDIGARMNYVRATLLFQQRKAAEGEQALAAAMTYMRQGSVWLHQIRQMERLYSAGLITEVGRPGSMTPRTAMEVYGLLLGDPVASDWGLRPMEALSVLVTPHAEALEHWFIVALARREHESALEIADLARRHRFLSSLPYGGRLESLRWVLEAPDHALDQRALLDRQELLAQYPAYAKLSQQARQVHADLEAMPLVAPDNDAALKQRQTFEQLALVSLQQEAVLREMAVRREKAGLVFPPIRSVKEIQQSIPEGHALLDFFAAAGDLYGFLLNREKYTFWRIKEPALLARRIETMLHDMGHYEANRELTVKDLVDNRWKDSASQVLEAIMAGSQADFSVKLAEVAIVPDGLLWYVPFEALQVNVGGQLRPLIDRFRIRYAPTASLAVPDNRGRSALAETAVVLGRLFPRQEDGVAEQAFSDLSRALPRAVAVSKPPLPAPSCLYASLIKQLIVLDDLVPLEQGAYSWAPIQIDRGKPGNTLADWLSLPWGGPDVVILPGFHTASENALARSNRAAPGAEVFLSVCALMSSGARTLLLSRWRTGGQSSLDLVREFAQELPHISPAEAWQRAVLVVASKLLDLEAEPRVKQSAADTAPRGNHPFIWGAFMLVDSGTGTKPPEGKPDVKPQEVQAKPVLPGANANPPGPEAAKPQPPRAPPVDVPLDTPPTKTP